MKYHPITKHGKYSFGVFLFDSNFALFGQDLGISTGWQHCRLFLLAVAEHVECLSPTEYNIIYRRLSPIHHGYNYIKRVTDKHDKQIRFYLSVQIFVRLSHNVYPPFIGAPEIIPVGCHLAHQNRFVFFRRDLNTPLNITIMRAFLSSL